MHRIAGKELLHLRLREFPVILFRTDHSLLQRQLLRMLQDLIDPASCLDGPCRRQMGIHLQKEPAGKTCLPGLVQFFFHRLDLPQGRFDQALRLFRVRERPADKRSESLEAGRRLFHIRHGKIDLSKRLFRLPIVWIDPAHFLGISQFTDNGRFLF